MSVVTGVVIVTMVEDEAMPGVLAWFDRIGKPRPAKVDDHGVVAGKHPQFDCWIGGYNGFVEVDGLVEAFLAADWNNPENAILILQPEEGSTDVVRP